MEKHKSKWKIAVGAIVVLVGIIAVLFASGVICIHKWEDATCTVPQTCSKCGKTKGDALGHKWVDPTCIEPKTCGVCGETEGVALGHKYGEWKITKEATCLEEGEREKACIVCGWKNYEFIPKLEHTYGKWKVTKKATCTEEGTQEKVCSVCGDAQTEAIPKADHTPGDWEVITEATLNSYGTKEKKCKRCEETLETKEFTKEPEAKGDKFNFSKEEFIEYANDRLSSDYTLLSTPHPIGSNGAMGYQLVYNYSTVEAVVIFREESDKVTAIGIADENPNMSAAVAYWFASYIDDSIDKNEAIEGLVYEQGYSSDNIEKQIRLDH